MTDHTVRTASRGWTGDEGGGGGTSCGAEGDVVGRGAGKGGRGERVGTGGMGGRDERVGMGGMGGRGVVGDGGGDGVEVGARERRGGGPSARNAIETLLNLQQA